MNFVILQSFKYHYVCIKYIKKIFHTHTRIICPFPPQSYSLTLKFFNKLNKFYWHAY